MIGRMASIRQLLRVPAGDSFDLAAVDPHGTPGLPAGRDRQWARDRLASAAEQARLKAA
jgi:hypothetical protein